MTTKIEYTLQLKKRLMKSEQFEIEDVDLAGLLDAWVRFDNTPQPMEFMAQLIKTIEENLFPRVSTRSEKPERLMNAPLSKYSGVSEVVDNVKETILHIDQLYKSKLQDRIEAYTWHNLTNHVAAVKELIRIRSKRRKLEDRRNLHMARFLSVMEVFKQGITRVRKSYPNFPIPWMSEADAMFRSYLDVIDETLQNHPAAHMAHLRIKDELIGLCHEIKFHPEDGLALVYTFFLFDVTPEALFEATHTKNIVLHFARQRTESVFERIRIQFDQSGQLAGALLALAYVDANPTKDVGMNISTTPRPPLMVRLWLEYARKLYGQLVATDTVEVIDVVARAVNGHLAYLQKPEPQIVITPTDDMSDEDSDLAWRILKVKLAQLHGLVPTYKRKWRNWPTFEEQMIFYTFYKKWIDNKLPVEKANQQARDEFDSWRRANGKRNKFSGKDVDEARDTARAIIRSVERKINLKII